MRDDENSFSRNAIFVIQVAVFHGIAAVFRSTGSHRILVVLCPTLTMAGVLALVLMEIGIDTLFRTTGN